MPSTSLDLAFDDTMLENVEDVWRLVMDYPARGEDGDDGIATEFMVFEDREQMGAADDDDNE